MKKRSDASTDWDDLRARIIGLGERSIRKNYYPELEQRLGELERFRTLLDQSNDLIFLVETPSGRFADVNESACRLLRLSRETILNMSIWDLVPNSVSEMMAAFFTKDQTNADVGGVTIATAFRSNGRELPVEMSVRLNVFKEAIYAVIVAHDIMERKRVEDALHERERHSQSLLRLSRKLEQAQTYAEVLNAVQEEVRDIIGYQNLWAYLFTPDKKQAKALFAKGPMAKKVMSVSGTGTITIQGDRMMEEFLETTEIMVVEDAQIDERTDKRIAAKMGNRTLVHVPILLFDRLLGSIGMGTFGDEGVLVPTASEREYLIGLASHMAVTLDRIHLLDKRKQSEQLFRALVENAPDFIARYDREYRRIYVNPAIQKLFKTSPENMLGKTPADQSPVYTPQVFMDHLKRVIETGTESVTEMPYRTAQGETHWSHMRFVPEFGPDGKVESVLHIGRDIHEIKENERRFRMLAENFPDFVARFDRDGRYVYVNPAFEHAFGMPAASIIGKTLWELHPHNKKEQTDIALALIRRIFNEGIAGEFEARWDTEKGERIFDTRYVPEKDATGNVATVLCIARDVTEQKRAEKELQMTNALLRAIIEAAPTGIIGLDLEGRVQIVWNPAAERMLGWSAVEVMGQYLPTVSLEKEDEFRKFREWIRSGKSLVGVEVQGGRRDGTLVDYSIYASPLRDVAGNITGSIAVLVDITERKQMTEALAAREREFRTLAEYSPDNIARYDVDCRTVYVNPALERTLGRPASEMLGTTPVEANLIAEAEKYQEKIIEVLETGKEYEMDMVLPDLGEGVRYHNIRFVAERGANDAIIGVQTIGRDITERKRAEEQRRNHLRFFESMDQVNRALQGPKGLKQIMDDVLDLVLSIFDCDRAYLGYPSDPDAPSWSLRAESTRPEYPGLLALGIDEVPIDPEATKLFRILLKADGPATFGPGNSYPLLANSTERFGLKSSMSMAFFPKVGQPWQFGIHQCSYARVWTSEDARLFHEIGRRLSDALTVLLTYQYLQESEQRYRLIAENTADTIAVFDLNLHPTYISPSVTKLRGYSVQEAMAQSLDQILVPESLQRAQEAFANQIALEENEKADPARTVRLELEEYCKDGSVIWVELVASFLRDENSQATAILTVTRDITERKQAEDDLRASETRFRILVDHAADAFFLYDDQGTILDVNRQACESLGYSRHELIGMTPYEIDSMLDHSFIGQLESRLDAGETVAFETRHRRKDGSVFPVEVRGRPFWHGERRFSVALARDITERKQAEEQRRSYVRFLESMDKVNRALQSANDLEWVMNDVLDLVLSVFDCDRAYLGYPCDPETPSWSLRAERTRPEYPGLLALGIDEVPIDPEGAETFRILLSADGPATFGPGNQYPLPGNATELFGLKSFMSMAFYPKVGKPWQFGIHQCSYARIWTSEDERLFHEIGRRLSDVLTVLLTYRHLQESEERYRQLVNLSPDGIAIHSDGRVQFVNPAMVHMSGATSADQLIGKSVLDGIHPDFREVARNRIDEMESTGQPIPFIEEKLLRLDGSSMDVELAAVPYNINNTRYIQIVARDITERKRAEEALRESEERLRQIASSLREVVWLRDVQTRQVLYVNPAFQELTGRTCESFYENRDIMIDAVHPDDKEWVIKALAQRFEGVPFDREHRIIRLDGSVRWVSSRIFPVRNEAGEIYRSASILEDITERKQHELEREAIIAVSTALRRATTRTDILNIILDQLINLFKADGAILVLPDPRTGGFINEMGRGPVGERMVGLSIPPGTGIGNWVLQNKKPYLNNRADQDPLFYRPDLLGDSYCIAFVPLTAQEQAIGSLWITRQTDILEQELRLLNAIADIAANAIHRVMLHEQTEQQLHHLMALHQIDLAISANFDLNVTLNVILKNVKDELEVDAASILLLNTVTHTLDYAAGIGFRTRRIEQSHVKLGNGCAGRAAQEYRTISYPNLDEAPGVFSRSSLLIDEAFLSHYATPLIVKGQVKGVLEIFHRQPLDSEPEWIDYFETLATQAAIAIESASLFENLQRTNLELMLAYDATIEGWSRALDLRDRETEGHTQRVTEMVLQLAEKIGMSDLEKVDLRRGALLHDIGKMGVPDSILLKPGPLSESEREVMQQHPTYALQMLSPIPYLKYALDIPYCHHERWDGSGYPRGLKGEQIPLSARLFAVVDVFDALTSARPYRAAWPVEEVYRYIQMQAGRYFDPEVVKIFLEGK